MNRLAITGIVAGAMIAGVAGLALTMPGSAQETQQVSPAAGDQALLDRARAAASVSHELAQIPGLGEVSHTRPSVDGAVRPDLIPDSVAYGFFLRTAAGGPSDDEQRRAKAFIKHALRNSRAASAGHVEHVDEVEADDALAGALMEAAGRFRAREREITLEARTLKDTGRSDLIPPLRIKREAAVAEAISRLPEALGAEGFTLVDEYVKNEMKRKIRMTF